MEWMDEIKEVYDKETSRRLEISKELGALLDRLHKTKGIDARVASIDEAAQKWTVSIGVKTFEFTETDVTFKQHKTDEWGVVRGEPILSVEEALQKILVQNYKSN